MLILHNGIIYTQDSKCPKAQALAIQNGHILAAGTNEDILNLAIPGCRVYDLHGSTVWPGLTDAHMHLQSYATLISMVDCETNSKPECLRRVAERARQTPPGSWILGHGWNQNLWPEGFGTAQDLDDISAQHPIYLTAKSLHASWANSHALQLAGITPNTPDPTGGVIQRDASGNPTGILLEMAAMNLVGLSIPAPTPSELEAILLQAQTRLWQMGLTGLHDFDAIPCFHALQNLRATGKLGLRVVKSLPLTHLPQAAALGLHTGFGDDWLRIGSVKLFADGALGPHTAAMLEPYQDDPANTGMLLLDKDIILEHGRVAASSGLSLAIHAIGDRANHEVLDGFSALRLFEEHNHLPPLRHRIEHVQLIDPADIARLDRLDIIASMQPIHAPSDQYAAEAFWGKRCETAYAWRSLEANGVTLAFGSDAPVESPNPFLGIAAAVTRQQPHSDQPAWYPLQAVSLQSALDGFTTGPAYAAGAETRLGRLTSGYLADLIVLEKNPFEIPVQQISQLKPLATMVNGEWVWQS